MEQPWHGDDRRPCGNAGELPLRPDSFHEFQRAQYCALRRIARLTVRRLTADDLMSEAWILACDISTRRGTPLRLREEREQDLLLAWLYNRFVRFERGNLPTYSLDTDAEDDELPWHERLASSEDADPLRCLLRLDEETETTMSSFSEFAAYLALLRRFHDGKKLASYLSIPLAVLRRRMDCARERAQQQATLFDGVETVDAHFVTRASWFDRLRLRWETGKSVWRSWTARETRRPRSPSLAPGTRPTELTFQLTFEH